MDRMTTDNPTGNLDSALNFVIVKDRRAILRYAEHEENVDLCEYISKKAHLAGCDVSADDVMEGSCINCDCLLTSMYLSATQAAELRCRLMLIEDILGDTYDLEALRQLMDAKRKGQLYFIPCKPGDTVYTLKKTWAGDITGKIEVGIVNRIEGDTSWVVWYKQVSGNPDMLHALKFEEYQQTWFLSQEEADAALLRWHEGQA